MTNPTTLAEASSAAGELLALKVYMEPPLLAYLTGHLQTQSSGPGFLNRIHTDMIKKFKKTVFLSDTV